MQKLRRRRGYSGVGISVAAASAVLVAVIWVLTLERIGYERDAAVRDAVRQNRNLALALEEQTVRAFKAVEHGTQAVFQRYREKGRKLDLAGLLADNAIDLGVFGDIGIFDERGDLVVRNLEFVQLNIADREFFRFHRDTPDGGLFIDKPIQARVSGKWKIPAVRRIDKPDGSFGGVVSALVEPTYFENFFRQIDLGADGVVLLVGLDGVVRAWRHGSRSSAGRDLSGGSLFRQLAAAAAGDIATPGWVDGVPRYLSYRRVRGFPLVVAVATSQAEVLAGFKRRENAYLLGTSFATVLIALFACGFLLAGFRREKMLWEKEKSDARYRATFDQAAIGIAHVSLDGTLLKVNRKLCDILGYPEGELLGRNVLDIRHPQEGSEKRTLRKDGTAIWVAVSAALVQDADGNPDYLVAMVKDITGRKAAEAQLREQLDELRRFQAVAVDRELRMEELEREIRELRGRTAA